MSFNTYDFYTELVSAMDRNPDLNVVDVIKMACVFHYGKAEKPVYNRRFFDDKSWKLTNQEIIIALTKYNEMRQLETK